MIYARRTVTPIARSLYALGQARRNCATMNSSHGSHRCPVWPCSPELDAAAMFAALAPAVSALQSGGLVAMPTETVYGLAASAQHPHAVAGIYRAKGRPSDNPLIVHCADIASVETITEPLSETERVLASKFWPGPLTLVLRPRSTSPLAAAVLSRSGTVAVRVPRHPVARALIAQCGLPLAAPSANTSGRPSATRAQHVLDDLGLSPELHGIIDGGETFVGLESTVIQCNSDTGVVHILRPGGVTSDMVKRLVGVARVRVSRLDESRHGSTTADDGPVAPGMKYAHYAPRAPLTLIDGSHAFTVQRIGEWVAQNPRAARIGVLTRYSERDSMLESLTQSLIVDVVVRAIGDSDALDSVAHDLFSSLLAFDAEGVDAIFAPVFENAGLGEAVMNRLNKAAAGRRWCEQDKHD